MERSAEMAKVTVSERLTEEDKERVKRLYHAVMRELRDAEEKRAAGEVLARHALGELCGMMGDLSRAHGELSTFLDEVDGRVADG